MTAFDAATITQLIDEAINTRQLVTVQALNDAIASIKRDAAVELFIEIAETTQAIKL